MNTKSSLILGLSMMFGLFLLGFILGGSIVQFKSMDRTVVVKGLAQKEVKADTLIWPISYIRASNDLSKIYNDLEHDTDKLTAFLKQNGFSDDEISISAPSITDKLAQNYGGTAQIKFRYSAKQTITLYTKKVQIARQSMRKISVLGKSGTTFRSNEYENRVEYIYSKLNEVKPQMIADATKNARASAVKFAEDSQSQLGKIKSARQGQFSIRDRDKNTPYIKILRVVSTIEYYLSD